MKQFTSLLTIGIATLFALSACDKEEGISTPDPFSDQFGYIYGKLNGEEFSLCNGTKDGTQYISGHSIYTREPELAYSKYIPIVPAPASLETFLGFSICIYPLEIGVQEITYPSKGIFHNYIAFYNKHDNTRTDYFPLKKPIQLQIDRIDHIDNNPYNTPFIEGEINGILYNKENPNDSIIVEGVKFGVHQ